MNLPLPPAAGPSTPAALSPVTAVAAVAGAAPVAPAQPVAPTAPAVPALSLSAQAQQALRLQVFQTLIAQLVTQVQAGAQASWPAGGTTPVLRELLTALIAQATAGLPQPQQLVAAQPWPQAWLNAVLAPAAAAPGAGAPAAAAPPHADAPATPAPNPPAPGNPATASALSGPAAPALASATTLAASAAPGLASLAAPAVPVPAAATLAAPLATPAPTLAGMAAPDAAPRLPPMLTWLVQQGVVQTSEGERGFALTLQVPQAWAQLQAAAAPPAGAAPAGAALLPGAGAAQLKLPFAAPAQQLESGALALVMQGAAPGGDKLRTSALLWLDFQPLPAAAQGAQSAQSAAAALAGLLPSTPAAQQALMALQAKNDPWLQMAALQASGQQPRDDQRLQERRTGLCTELGCPYRGKASCAQPFCAEMNRVWASVRIGPTGT
jgi:hypothetical protein